MKKCIFILAFLGLMPVVSAFGYEYQDSSTQYTTTRAGSKSYKRTNTVRKVGGYHNTINNNFYYGQPPVQQQQRPVVEPEPMVREYAEQEPEPEYVQPVVKTERKEEKKVEYTTQTRKYFLAHPFFQPLKGSFGSVTDIAYTKNSFKFNVQDGTFYDMDVPVPTGYEPFVYGTVGIHPDHVGDLTPERLEIIRQLSRKDKILAIGEIGLDYHWMVSPKEEQKKWFIRQLELAMEENLPVVIHSRDAARDTFEIMRDVHAGSTPGVIHCYSGSVEMAREYVKLGYYLGIGGVVTFRNSKALKRVVEEIPLSCLVLETDCPYLSPAPYRGKRNSSDRLSYVADAIASLKGCNREDVERITWENGHRLYGLPMQQA